MRVEYYIHGRGRGHASRSVPIARRLLEAGHEVRVHGGGDGADLVDTLADKESREPLLPGPRAIATLPLRAVQDARRLRRAKPDAVVSDGDQSALMAGRLLRLPTIAVGHDLVYTACVVPRELSRLSVYSQRANGAVPTYLAARGVAVHFLPTKPRWPGVRVARPDPIGLPGGPPEDEGFFLAYFRDANGGAAVDLLRAQGREVRWHGPGAVDERGTPCPTISREQFVRELARCSAVVASAGSNLLAECVLFNKPILALYRAGDAEQSMNAVWAQRARIALSSRIDRVSRSLMAHFVSQVDAHDFTSVPLAERLRPVSSVVLETLDELAG